jgi:hypothetical protein
MDSPSLKRKIYSYSDHVLSYAEVTLSVRGITIRRPAKSGACRSLGLVARRFRFRALRCAENLSPFRVLSQIPSPICRAMDETGRRWSSASATSLPRSLHPCGGRRIPRGGRRLPRGERRVPRGGCCSRVAAASSTRRRLHRRVAIFMPRRHARGSGFISSRMLHSLRVSCYIQRNENCLF